MKGFFSKCASFIYAAGETTAEVFGTTLSINMLQKASSPVAYVAGGLTGAIRFATTYYFQGAEIRKRLSSQKHEEIDDEQFLANLANPSKKKQSAYLTLKYGYILSNIATGYLRTCLLYSASKAWLHSLINDEELPLTFISPLEGGCLALYYVLFNLPLKLTAEMPETCRGIRQLLQLSVEQVPDKRIMDTLFGAISPIAKLNSCRKVIRVSGTIADTFEHMTPLVIIIPTPWLLDIASGPDWLAETALGVSSVTLLIITATVLAQTYLFEGSFSEKNLLKIASHSKLELDKEKPWLNRFVASIFHYFLYLGGPLHGVDTGLSILLALRELKAPSWATHSFAIVSLLIAWMGNHYSEVKESQAALEEITLPHSRVLTKAKRLTFFATPQDYGSTKQSSLDYDFPKGIMNYSAQLPGRELSIFR